MYVPPTYGDQGTSCENRFSLPGLLKFPALVTGAFYPLSQPMYTNLLKFVFFPFS